MSHMHGTTCDRTIGFLTVSDVCNIIVLTHICKQNTKKFH